MTIGASLYSWLTANSAITTLVSDRVYPHVIPQNQANRPALTFTQEDGDYIEHLAGRSDTRMAEYSIDCWASTYLAVRNLAETVQSELVGFRGVFGAHTAESIRLVNDFDGPPDDEVGYHRVNLRFRIAYN